MNFKEIKKGDILLRDKIDYDWIYVFYVVTSIAEKEAKVIQFELMESGVLHIFLDDKIRYGEDLLKYLVKRPKSKIRLIHDIFTYKANIK